MAVVDPQPPFHIPVAPGGWPNERSSCFWHSGIEQRVTSVEGWCEAHMAAEGPHHQLRDDVKYLRDQADRMRMWMLALVASASLSVVLLAINLILELAKH